MDRLHGGMVPLTAAPYFSLLVQKEWAFFFAKVWMDRMYAGMVPLAAGALLSLLAQRK